MFEAKNINKTAEELGLPSTTVIKGYRGGVPLLDMESLKDQPDWLTEEAYFTLKTSYLFNNETPKQMWKRVAKTAASRLDEPELEDVFFSLFWLGWLGGATPVLANMGTPRGLPVSCNGIEVQDSVHGIFYSLKELAHLSSQGAGLGVFMGNIRSRGSLIGKSLSTQTFPPVDALTNEEESSLGLLQNLIESQTSKGSRSAGVVPWCKVYDSTTVSVSQSGVRRGKTAIYLPFSHGDIKEFIRICRPQGDENLRCLNIQIAVTFTDEDMRRIEDGDPEAVELFGEILRTRAETGSPYLFWVDTANRYRPLGYEKLDLFIKASQLCNEAFGYTDEFHSFVCCLSSMNLAEWEQYKDTDAIYYATMFLDGVIEDYIIKASDKIGFENSVRFAKASRMLGLGVLGYHTLLQQKRVPFESFQARLINKIVFKRMAEETNRASKDMAVKYGEPEWCKGTGVRNSMVLAIAPTVSNSLICGHVSAGIEPIAANCFSKQSAKGAILYYNPIFKEVLQAYSKDTPEVWDSIVAAKGSVQHLDFLTDLEKDVFLTAREINQMEIVNQAADRQKLMDTYRQSQGQSVNLFFTKDVDPTFFAKVHFEAWKKGLKGLYYCRSASASQADLPTRTQEKISNITKGVEEECLACHG